MTHQESVVEILSKSLAKLGRYDNGYPIITAETCEVIIKMFKEDVKKYLTPTEADMLSNPPIESIQPNQIMLYMRIMLDIARQKEGNAWTETPNPESFVGQNAKKGAAKTFIDAAKALAIHLDAVNGQPSNVTIWASVIISTVTDTAKEVAKIPLDLWPYIKWGAISIGALFIGSWIYTATRTRDNGARE